MAKEVLELPSHALEVNTRKLLALCRDDFDEAAERGTTSIKLHSILSLVRANLHSDVQDNEGINSVLRCITERSRNMSLQLVDARARIRKTLLESQTQTKLHEKYAHSGSRRSVFLEKQRSAESVARHCLQHYNAGHRLLCDQVNRFDVPEPSSRLL